jgi:tetratricopeptide (TPR) repeat protein
MLINNKTNSGADKFLFGLRVMLAAVIFLLLGRAFLFAQDLQELTNEAAAAQTGSSVQGNEPVQMAKPVEDVFQFKETPKLRGYTYNLKNLIEVAEKNIKKVDNEIMQVEIRKRNEEREALIVAYFERGNQLYKEGKLKEAKQEWEQAVSISKDPEMKKYIAESGRRFKLAKQEEKKRLEAEERELRRLLRYEEMRTAMIEEVLERLSQEYNNI